LCTDKTGTITEGVIRINSILNAAGTADLFVAELAYWNAHLQTGYENPIDDALRQISLLPTFHPRRLAEIPYDFNRKRLSVLFENAGQKWMVTKGAFDQILAACTHLYIAPEQTLPLDPNAIASLRSQYDDFGTQGLRVIALCYKNTEQAVIIKEDERDMVFAGFILLQDPVKKGISDTIAALGRLQIDLKIITGDNQNVARAIALQLGIENPVVLTGEALQSLTEDRLEETVQGVHIFAAIEPQVKEQIVKILRRKNVVAYIGDGINDVSALHAADVGISVSNAVDVAREVADFVLMEKDLSVLIDGVKEGRKTFANTLKYIYINTGSTFGNMFSVAFASLWLPFLPMLPKQILLTNFITDFPYLSVSGDQVDEEQMQRPGRWNLKLLRNYMLLFGTHSSLFDMLTFLFLYYYMKANESAFQTGWFIESILTELFILFVIRTRKNFFKSTPGRLLVFLSLLGVAITLILPYTPLGPQVGLVPLPGFALLLLLAITATYLLTADLLKVWFFKKFDPQ
jgi:Mg2+-importing ATPase